jgi:hypothetical protein
MTSPDSSSIAARLDELAALRAAADMTRQEYEARRAEILRVVQAELEALDAEFQPLLDAAAQRQQALEAEIRGEVLAHGGSIRGAQMQAVYMRGRVTWDTRGLEDYAADNPAVLDFRREGQPSVQLRAVKAKPAATDETDG